MTDRLSPVIKPTKYERPDGRNTNKIEAVVFGGWSLNTDNISNSKLASQMNDDLVMYYDDNGSVYVTEDACHVAESVYRSNAVVFLREKCLSALVMLDDAGIVEGLEVIDRRDVRGVGTQ